ncbi:MAG: hypothetical protein K2X39_09800, partial [Silvanigrellaceae bacterium]|nr:hypothetical protein [Silvanigrellaceae bacterium]
TYSDWCLDYKNNSYNTGGYLSIAAIKDLIGQENEGSLCSKTGVLNILNNSVNLSGFSLVDVSPLTDLLASASSDVRVDLSDNKITNIYPLINTQTNYLNISNNQLCDPIQSMFYMEVKYTKKSLTSPGALDFDDFNYSGNPFLNLLKEPSYTKGDVIEQIANDR